tara:strand:+ start:1196 stop:2659 length:1464 start_codon:yes stop_codon:yes gene_type:complete
MATGLEGQLIYGAGQAAKSHQDIIGTGMDEAIKGVTEGVKEIATKAGEIHQAKLAEEEKLKQEQEDLVKGYDAAWEANLTQYIEDQGLPMEAWNQAHDLAEDIKVDHDSCPTGQEGNRCRREATVKLREMAAQWKEANEVLASAVETAGLMKSGKLEASLYDNSETGIENKKILSGLSKDNITSRMKNDAEIEELTAQLSTAGPDEQMALEQEIAALEKSNQRVVGWDIPGVGFVSSKDERLSNLYTLKANDVGVTYDKGVRDKISGSWEGYRTGAKDGAPFNMAVSKGNYENVINEDNIASVYYDGKITGSSEPLRDNLRQHPMLYNANTDTYATYDSLGITGKDKEGLDLDGNGVISEDEMTNLIDALSDPKHPNFDFKVSRNVAAGYMALNEEKEYNKVIYGQHYYVKSNGEPTTLAEQEEMRTKATTPNANESLIAFEKRGGCVPCAEELGITWNDETKTWNKPEFEAEDIIQEGIDKGLITG